MSSSNEKICQARESTISIINRKDKNIGPIQSNILSIPDLRVFLERLRLSIVSSSLKLKKLGGIIIYELKLMISHI